MEALTSQLMFSSKRQRNQSNESQSNLDFTKKLRATTMPPQIPQQAEECQGSLLDGNFELFDSQIIMRQEHFYFDSNPRKCTKLCFGKYYPPSTSKENVGPIDIVVKSQLTSAAARQEARLLDLFQFSKYSPKSYGISAERNDMFYYAMEQLKVDLFDLRFKSHRLQTFSTVFYLAEQCLRSLKDFHSMGYVHGDVKPSNFMIQNFESYDEIIKLVDYGLAMPFRTPSGRPIAPRHFDRLIGTPRYASLSVHRGYEPRRADDLVSFVYTICELIHLELPWTKFELLDCPTTFQNSVYSSKKDVFPLNRIVAMDAMRPFACPMSRLVQKIENITWDQNPDYGFLEECLEDALNVALLAEGKTDYPIPVYDWIDD